MYRLDLWLLSLFSQKTLCCICQESYLNKKQSRLQNGVHWRKGNPWGADNLTFFNILSKQDKLRIYLKKTHFPVLFAKITYWPPNGPIPVSKVIWPLVLGILTITTNWMEKLFSDRHLCQILSWFLLFLIRNQIDRIFGSVCDIKSPLKFLWTINLLIGNINLYQTAFLQSHRLLDMVFNGKIKHTHTHN